MSARSRAGRCALVDWKRRAMLVRIRFDKGAHIHRKQGKNRHLALAAAALLVPSSLMACVLGLWRLAADLQWTTGFAISSGPFSHWLVWILLAVVGFLLAIRLNRYGRGGSILP
jgi:hypothetical protein